MKKNTHSLFIKKEGSGSPVLLLHGMAASHSYWDRVVDELGNNLAVVRVDLLGFGASPMPRGVAYDYDQHIESIRKTIRTKSHNEPMTIVGHSMGALLATRYATMYPNEVKNLVLVNPALYKSSLEARQGITNGSKLKERAYYGWTSSVLCRFGCGMPKFMTTRILGRYFKDRSKKMLCDITAHTYESYKKSRRNVIAGQNTVKELGVIKKPIMVIAAKNEEPIALANTRKLKNYKNIQVVELDGTHTLPLENPVFIAKKIIEANNK